MLASTFKRAGCACTHRRNTVQPLRLSNLSFMWTLFELCNIRLTETVSLICHDAALRVTAWRVLRLERERDLGTQRHSHSRDSEGQPQQRHTDEDSHSRDTEAQPQQRHRGTATAEGQPQQRHRGTDTAETQRDSHSRDTEGQTQQRHTGTDTAETHRDRDEDSHGRHTDEVPEII